MGYKYLASKTHQKTCPLWRINIFFFIIRLCSVEPLGTRFACFVLSELLSDIFTSLGSRSFNITITNDRGRMICELTDLKLQRAQSGVISKPIGALELVSEPLSVPDIVPLAPALSQHQGQDDYMRLFHVLDRLVLDQLRKSFKLLLYRKKSVSLHVARRLQRRQLTSF
jgi:hypothetical protein